MISALEIGFALSAPLLVFAYVLAQPKPKPSASALVTLSGVAARTPDGHTLFDNLTLAFGRERTAVVGRNGVGKTTLLRLIAGEAEPAEGVVARAGTVGVLAQSADPAQGETVADTLGVAPGLAVLARVLTGEGTADDLADADWTLETRIDDALAEVGLDGLGLDRLTASLSGGEQTRLRLAALLAAAPDLIVLDEPTNNLDAGARAMIADVLARWKGGAVVVSHDRILLRGMDRIVELSGLGARVYGGGWNLYVERREAERAATELALDYAERDAGRVARESQKAVEKRARRDRAGRAYALSGSAPKISLGVMARRAEESAGREHRLAERKAQEAETALEQAREAVERVRRLTIPMPPTGLAAGKTVSRLDEAGVAGRLAPVSLTLTGPERVAVTGPNGAGKTTLLRLLAGEIEPDTGAAHHPVSAALLDQHAAILKPEETLLESYRRLNPRRRRTTPRRPLARFLFRTRRRSAWSGPCQAASG